MYYINYMFVVLHAIEVEIILDGFFQPFNLHGSQNGSIS